jgi:hypothetical protein
MVAWPRDHKNSVADKNSFVHVFEIASKPYLITEPPIIIYMIKFLNSD